MKVEASTRGGYQLPRQNVTQTIRRSLSLSSLTNESQPCKEAATTPRPLPPSTQRLDCHKQQEVALDNSGSKAKKARTSPEVPIAVRLNGRWLKDSAEGKSANKYRPVAVLFHQHPGHMDAIKGILDRRVALCQELASKKDGTDACSWLSFVRPSALSERNLNSKNVPALVLTSSSASSIAIDLKKSIELAWHPANMRNEPVYLILHKSELGEYREALSEAMSIYKNLHLVGWDGGEMSGFGTARAAALAFADTLSYKPNRIIMVDHDVVSTNDTRPSNPAVARRVNQLHEISGKHIVGYGTGFGQRSADIPRTAGLVDHALGKPKATQLVSPTQQLVSIRAPFRNNDVGPDGLYPPYMVSGNEDQVMTLGQGIRGEEKNTSITRHRISKKTLPGTHASGNRYISELRPRTLEQLFEAEKHTPIEFEHKTMTLESLVSLFAKRGWISSHPSAESHLLSSLIIEKIIIKLLSNDQTATLNPKAIFNSARSPSF